MDLKKLGRMASGGGGGPGHLNASQPLNLTELPGNLLEAVIPGYGIISRYILDNAGFDISIFVTIGVLLFAGTKAITYLWTTLEAGFSKYCMSSVHIDSNDDLYSTTLKWIAEQNIIKRTRAIKAKSVKGSAVDEEADQEQSSDAALDPDGTFNFGKWQAMIPPRYEPHYGKHRFWHNGSYLVFSRQRDQRAMQSPWSNGQEDDLLELSCVGWSTQPIKDLLTEIKLWSLSKSLKRTTIRNPAGKERSRFQGAWSKTTSRPSRPMSTVILDDAQKKMIVKDMNEFLHPASPKWYATRGIPYRRGYLFHGPPGTGKTSLSFALAGIFGLEIYCIPLNDPELSESDLGNLFNQLPRRCIVLLEDIDEAGIKRDAKSDEGKSGSGKSRDKTKTKDKDGKALTNGEVDGKAAERNGMDNKETSKDNKVDDTNWTLQDLARALKAVAAEPAAAPAAQTPGRAAPPGRGGGRRNDKTAPPAPGANTTIGTGISLSGLLNAIDGVATHEGRILIMTTNHPEKLDHALIRSGRVDMQVHFTFAKGPQIKELFLRMYAADVKTKGVWELDMRGKKDIAMEEEELMNGNGIVNGHALGGGKSEALDIRGEKKQASIMDELKSIAEEFANHLPDEMFAPSDVQGFLLLHKKEPRVALETVEAWRDEQLQKRLEKEDEEDEDGD